MKAVPKYKPTRACIRRGLLKEAFLRFEFGEAFIRRGLYKDGLIFGILQYAGTSV